MVHGFQGNYTYSEKVVGDWKSNAIGVYYCGYPTTEGKLRLLYIGVGTSENGMRGRLLDHLREDYWPDATHFGYQQCDSAKEALDWESAEILKYKPKYNTQGK